jgi:hypothetical protein
MYHALYMNACMSLENQSCLQQLHQHQEANIMFWLQHVPAFTITAPAAGEPTLASSHAGSLGQRRALCRYALLLHVVFAGGSF